MPGPRPSLTFVLPQYAVSSMLPALTPCLRASSSVWRVTGSSPRWSPVAARPSSQRPLHGPAPEEIVDFRRQALHDLLQQAVLDSSRQELHDPLQQEILLASMPRIPPVSTGGSMTRLAGIPPPSRPETGVPIKPSSASCGVVSRVILGRGVACLASPSGVSLTKGDLRRQEVVQFSSLSPLPSVFVSIPPPPKTCHRPRVLLRPKVAGSGLRCT